MFQVFSVLHYPGLTLFDSYRDKVEKDTLLVCVPAFAISCKQSPRKRDLTLFETSNFYKRYHISMTQMTNLLLKRRFRAKHFLWKFRWRTQLRKTVKYKIMSDSSCQSALKLSPHRWLTRCSSSVVFHGRILDANKTTSNSEHNQHEQLFLKLSFKIRPAFSALLSDLKI